MKTFKYISFLILLSALVLASFSAWSAVPEAKEIYQKLIPLFASGNVDDILNDWDRPVFEENGTLFWQWGNGQICCIVEKKRAKIVTYAETVDSSQMDPTLRKRYERLKKQFVDLLGPEDAEGEGEIKAQNVKTITALWERDGLQLGWICSFNEQMQISVLQFLLRR